jgi:hypothetical protein
MLNRTLAKKKCIASSLNTSDIWSALETLERSRIAQIYDPPIERYLGESNMVVVPLSSQHCPSVSLRVSSEKCTLFENDGRCDGADDIQKRHLHSGWSPG